MQTNNSGGMSTHLSVLLKEKMSEGLNATISYCLIFMGYQKDEYGYIFKHDDIDIEVNILTNPKKENPWWYNGEELMNKFGFIFKTEIQLLSRDTLESKKILYETGNKLAKISHGILYDHQIDELIVL